MKGFKRLMAALLAVAIMFSAAPVMKTEAAAKPSISGAKFIQWVDYQHYYDQTACWIGVPKQGIDMVRYKVYNLKDEEKRRGTASRISLTKDGKYECFQLKGTRNTSVTVIRMQVRKNGVWSDWSGRIAIIPIHTDKNVKISLSTKEKSVTLEWDKFSGLDDYVVFISRTGTGGWTRAVTTTGKSAKITKFNGKPFVMGQTYYIKVIGRKKISGKYVLAKGNVDSFAQYKFKFYYK